MPPRRTPRRPPPAQPDAGAGGIFQGLAELIERLAALSEAAKTEGGGTIDIKGMSEQVQGVYGFSIRSGLGQATRVEHFGNLRATERGPEVADAREPLVDLFDEGQELLIVAELPGAADDEISVTLTGDVLAIEASGARRYARELLLESPVDPASLRRSYRNGILEIRLRKR